MVNFSVCKSILVKAFPTLLISDDAYRGRDPRDGDGGRGRGGRERRRRRHCRGDDDDGGGSALRRGGAGPQVRQLRRHASLRDEQEQHEHDTATSISSQLYFPCVNLMPNRDVTK